MNRAMPGRDSLQPAHQENERALRSIESHRDRRSTRLRSFPCYGNYESGSAPTGQPQSLRRESLPSVTTPAWHAWRSDAQEQKIALSSWPPLCESPGAFKSYDDLHVASPSPRVRSRRAGFPATTVRAATLFDTTAPAPTIAPAPIVTPPRMTAPDPMVARRSTRMGMTFQSTSVCKVPSGRDARGNKSLTKQT